MTDTSLHRLPPAPGRLLVLALALLLAACAAPQQKRVPTAEPSAQESIERARALIAEGRPLAAVREYRDLADEAGPDEAQRWRLRIVELLFEEGYPELALQWHERLDQAPVPESLRTRKRIVDAEVAIARRQGVRALRVLPGIDASMDDARVARILDVRAQAYRLTGQPDRAILVRLRREQFLREEEAVDANHEAIWALLQSVPADQLDRLAALDEGAALRGWIELARAVRSARLGERAVTDALDAWRDRHGGHPASERFVAALRDRVSDELNYPGRVALLLPLSGRLADPARAIRDGIMGAYYELPAGSSRPRVMVIDTGEDGLSPGAAYERAVAEGAGFVIGPLAKDSVARLAERNELPVPILTLNYLPDDATRPGNDFYQFGLLPEDEARQAAGAAVQNDHFNAITLVPAGSWGRRMETAFAERFEELGGVVVGQGRYNSRGTDYGRPIQALLNLDMSRARERRLESVIGRNVRFEPRRRRDVEVVFVAAMPKQARLIEPQLEFHRAGDVPTYATSHVFTGTPDPDADWDMNGLFFTEIPWIVDNLDETDGLYARVTEHWPGTHERFPRLYALGVDAFALVPHVERLAASRTAAVTGRTGRLTVDVDRRVHRQLRWAMFVKGRPVPVSRPEAKTLEQAEEALGSDIRERAEGD